MKKLSEQFNSIAVKKGEYFSVELVSNSASSGYSWELEVKNGQAATVRKDYVQIHPGDARDMAPGTPSIERTVMQAKESGEIEIVANLRRPWEKGKAPAQTRTFKVTVE